MPQGDAMANIPYYETPDNRYFASGVDAGVTGLVLCIDGSDNYLGSPLCSHYILWQLR